MAKKKAKATPPSESSHHDNKTIVIALLAATLEGFAEAAGGAVFHHEIQQPTLPSAVEEKQKEATRDAFYGTGRKATSRATVTSETPAYPPLDDLYTTFQISIKGKKEHLTENVRMPWYEPAGWLRDATPIKPQEPGAILIDYKLSDAVEFKGFIDQTHLLDKLTAAGDLTSKQRKALGDVVEVKIAPLTLDVSALKK